MLNLSRYSKEQEIIIREYFECLRLGRRSGCISPVVLQRELDYWSKFEPSDVVEALQIHLKKYPTLRESYTRGILRNVALQNQMAGRGKIVSVRRKEQNYVGRDGLTDFERKQVERGIVKTRAARGGVR